MRKIHKAWLIGSETPVGQAILKQIDTMKINIIATDMDDVDVSQIDEALSFSYLNHPDAVINCYDLYDIDECEKDPIKAYKINSIVPRNLAICSRKIEARFIHLSTTSIFSKEIERGYTEFDEPSPSGIYAKSKFQGEKYVRELNNKYFIVRSDYIYGKKEDLIKRPFKENKIISPTSCNQIASFIISLMDTPEYGVYHASSTGTCTYNEFLKKYSELSNDTSILELSIKNTDCIKNIKIDKFMLKLCNVYKFPNWKEDLEKYINNY